MTSLNGLETLTFKGLMQANASVAACHQQNPWVLLSPLETSGALGGLGALRRTSAPPGTWGVNLFPPEGSGESRRVQECLGKGRRAKEGEGGPGKAREGREAG